MRKKFKFTWLFMILLGILALAACTNSDDSSSTEPVQKSDEDVEKSEEGKTVISFWHAMSGSGQTALDNIVADFNASQDDYEVKAEFQGSYEESLTKLRSVGGTADAPAITQVFEVGTKYMIESGFIEPMQKFIDEDNYDLSQLEENILNYYSLDGELYSMPFNSSTPVMLYNKDAFKAAGLDPENPP
ncbi:MAG: extracellular solute-binding protein, partial [Psychrobacillus sp.]